MEKVQVLVWGGHSCPPLLKLTFSKLGKATAYSSDLTVANRRT